MGQLCSRWTKVIGIEERGEFKDLVRGTEIKGKFDAGHVAWTTLSLGLQREDKQEGR